MNDIFAKALDKFLEAVEQDLRKTELDDFKIRVFLDSYKKTFHEEFEIYKQNKGVYPTELEELIDDTLRMAISKLEDAELKDTAEVLWALRAEQRLERLENREEGEAGEIIAFKKPR